jgi:hypothetical protein
MNGNYSSTLKTVALNNRVNNSVDAQSAAMMMECAGDHQILPAHVLRG